MKAPLVIALVSCLLHVSAAGQVAPAGSVAGSAWQHDAVSRSAAIANANVALPSGLAGGSMYFGKWLDAPTPSGQRVPTVVFLHGSSGLGLKAIEDWQRWLAELGVASVAPDSFALPGRLTYKSPVSKEVYERIHALRAAEIDIALAAVKASAWADPGRLLLAGTSEGAVAVARYGGEGYSGRIIFSWSCEDNYFVGEHLTAVTHEQPVLNVISSTDPYFSSTNPWLGNSSGKGHCAEAFRHHRSATIVLIPGAPHTLLNLPAARNAVAAFVRDVLRP